MADQDVDDTTAAEFGHALLRWVVDTDPAGVARFMPALDPGSTDDARAARLGHSVVETLRQLDVV